MEHNRLAMPDSSHHQSFARCNSEEKIQTAAALSGDARREYMSETAARLFLSVGPYDSYICMARPHFIDGRHMARDIGSGGVIDRSVGRLVKNVPWFTLSFRCRGRRTHWYGNRHRGQLLMGYIGRRLKLIFFIFFTI
jgi:hypothetical protein